MDFETGGNSIEETLSSVGETETVDNFLSTTTNEDSLCEISKNKENEEITQLLKSDTLLKLIPNPTNEIINKLDIESNECKTNTITLTSANDSGYPLETHITEHYLIPDQPRNIEEEKVVIEEIKIQCSHNDNENKRPRIPIPTYHWELVRRSKEQGGYPWTHLYKLPLGPNDKPEVIFRYSTHPRTRKKIVSKLLEDEQINETEQRISEVKADQEDISKEFNILQLTSQHQIATNIEIIDSKPSCFILKSKKEETPYSNIQCCSPFVHKIKTMADKHFHHHPHQSQLSSQNIHSTSSNTSQPLLLNQEQPILRLKQSPKTGDREIHSYVERRDSDDILEILELDDSPRNSSLFKSREINVENFEDSKPMTEESNKLIDKEITTPQQEDIHKKLVIAETKKIPPLKAPRSKKEHVYEDIEDFVTSDTTIENGQDNLRIALEAEDEKIKTDLNLPFSNEKSIDDSETDIECNNKSSLAPMSSVDSASSVEGDSIQIQMLPALTEEVCIEEHQDADSIQKTSEDTTEKLFIDSDKDVGLIQADMLESEHNHKEETSFDNENKVKIDSRWSKMSDHEYEPVGQPQNPKDMPSYSTHDNGKFDQNEQMETTQEKPLGLPNINNDTIDNRQLLRTPTDEEELSAFELQQQIENRFFNTTSLQPPITGVTYSRNDIEVEAPHSSPIKEKPKKSLITSIQETSRNMQTKIKNSAGTVSAKLKQKRKSPHGSPLKVKERKKYKAPTLSKIKNIKIPKTNMSKFKKIDFNFPSMKKSNLKNISTNEEGVAAIKGEDTTISTNILPTIQTSQSNISQVIINLPINVPAPIEISPPLPTQDAPKKNWFTRPEIPKLNLSEKFNSLRKRRARSEERNIPGDETKKSLSEKFLSLRKRTKSIDKKPIEVISIDKDEFGVNSATEIVKDEELNFAPQTEHDNVISQATEDNDSNIISQDTRYANTQKSQNMDVEYEHQPNVDNISEPFKNSEELVLEHETPIPHVSQNSDLIPTKKSRFTRPEFTRFNFSEKLASYRRSRSTDNSKIDNISDKDFENDVEPAEVSTKTRFSRPELPSFKITEKFKNIRLRRSKSLKEPLPSELTEQIINSSEDQPPAKSTKKLLQFEFKTYPRFLSKLRKQKKIETDNLDQDLRIEFPTMSKSAVRRLSLQSEESSDNTPADIKTDLFRSFNRGNKIYNYRESSIEGNNAIDHIDESFDEENREIHHLSKFREDEEKQRNTIVRQESDLNSEDEKILEWVKRETQKNKLIGRNDSDVDSFRYEQDNTEFDEHVNVRQLTPYSNQETQSSGGSSGYQRGKGVLEEIDDDEFFLRKKGISDHDLRMTEYISSTLREGLSNPLNSLAQVGQYDAYYRNRNIPSDDVNKYFEDEIPSRPNRKIKNREIQLSEHAVPIDNNVYFDSRENSELNLYEQNEETLEPTDIFRVDATNHYHDVPPVAPKRHRKSNQTNKDETEDLEDYMDRVSVHEVFTKVEVPSPRWTTGPRSYPLEDELVVHRIQHEYVVPVTDSESYKTSPVPLPRRSRSNTRISDKNDKDDEYTNSNEIDEPICVISHDPKDAHGYAVIKKDIPPRPPAPRRLKRSNSSLTDEKKINTLSGTIAETTLPPSRPDRNYSTIIPSKPPRRKSFSSADQNSQLQTSRSSPDITQYEKVDSDPGDSLRDLQSGDIINKMKYRPLPPPPRPPRENKRKRSNKHDDCDDDDDDDDDECAQINASDLVSLQDILQMEQEAEIERARQLVKGKSLERGIQRFKESNHRNFSEKSRPSTGDYQKNSRPITPAVILVERTTSTPAIVDNTNQTLTEVQLMVKTIDLTDDFEDNEILNNIENQIVLDHLHSDVNNHDENMDQAADVDENDEKVINIDVNIRPHTEEEQGEKYFNKKDPNSSEHAIRMSQEKDNVLPETNTISSTSHDIIGRLQINNLEVDRLNVNSLYANQIIVSEIQGESINTQALECTSGNFLTRTMDLPVQFIDEIVERIRASDRMHDTTIECNPPPRPLPPVMLDYSENATDELNIEPGTNDNVEILDDTNETAILQESAATEERFSHTPLQVDESVPPMRPPPPAQDYYQEYLPFSIPPPSFHQLRNPSDDETPQFLTPHQILSAAQLQSRRRRQQKKTDSTSEEEQSREMRLTSRQRHSTQSPEPSISELGSQLFKACSLSVSRCCRQALTTLNDGIRKEDPSRDLHITIILMVIIVAGLILFGMAGDKAVHHHHWDYFNPPDSGNSHSQ